MKKLTIIAIAVVFIIGTLVSCNANVCPAYVMETPALQVENNG